MGLFDKLFSKNDKPDRKQGDASRRNIKSGDVIQTMLVNAKACLDDDRPEQAFDLYKSIVEMALDTTAQVQSWKSVRPGKGELNRTFYKLLIGFIRLFKMESLQLKKCVRKVRWTIFIRILTRQLPVSFMRR